MSGFTDFPVINLHIITLPKNLTGTDYYDMVSKMVYAIPFWSNNTLEDCLRPADVSGGTNPSTQCSVHFFELLKGDKKYNIPWS